LIVRDRRRSVAHAARRSTDLPDGQFAHARHAQFARRANLPQLAALAPIGPTLHGVVFDISGSGASASSGRNERKTASWLTMMPVTPNLVRKSCDRRQRMSTPCPHPT